MTLNGMQARVSSAIPSKSTTLKRTGPAPSADRTTYPCSAARLAQVTAPIQARCAANIQPRNGRFSCCAFNFE